MSRHVISTTIWRPRLAASALILATTLIAPQSASAGASTVVKVNGTDLFCEFDTPEAAVFMFAIVRDRSDDSSFAFVDMAIEPTDPAAPTIAGGKDDPALTPTGFHDSWEVVNDATGEVAGAATVDASFTGTGRFRTRSVYQNAVQTGIFEDLIVSGHLTVTTTTQSYMFDLAGCDAGTQEHRLDMAHHPNGPKVGGTPPSNDAPDGAIAVSGGSAIQQWTNGAAVDAEVPCVMGEGDEAFEFGLGRTVWFSVVGTGGPITIDPRGSDFDTVVAAYAVDNGESAQVGCVDDDDVGQAQGLLTFDTSPGRTYLIQIGGVLGNLGSDSDDPQWGRLRLNIS